MPWCPECKAEYEEGVMQCVDCEIELVKDLNDNIWMNLVAGENEEGLEELINFLKYSKINELQIIQDNDSGKYILQVKKEVFEQAKKYVNVFLHNKKMEAAQNEEKPKEDNLQSKKVVYEDKQKKVEELKSSAFSFTVIGVIGSIFLILVIVDVISLNIDPTYKRILFGFLLFVTISFIFIGITSIKKVKEVSAEADAFTKKIEEIKKWFLLEYTVKNIDKTIEEDAAEESKYFVRSEFIKQKIKETYTELEDAIIEGVTEEIYDELYEK